jgi:hypothetical protein
MNKKMINIKCIKGYFILLLLVIISCNSKNSESNSDENLNNSYTIEQENTDDEISHETNDDNGRIIENTYSGCKFEDGDYSATVDYNNSETGYSATYTLDVEVSDCQVIRINFPNDGYLDEDHISYADIDEDGSASVDGEDGKTYQIQIDN